MKHLGGTRGLGQRLVDELRASRNGHGRRHAMVRDQDIVAEAEVTDVDRVGLASHRITVRREAKNGQALDEHFLKGQVDDIGRRLRYLPEPLEAVELDERCEGATLRSAPPSETDEGRSFFELRLLNGREVHVTRWFTQRSSNWRKPTEFPLTYDVFAKLVDDLADTIESE